MFFLITQSVAVIAQCSVVIINAFSPMLYDIANVSCDSFIKHNTDKWNGGWNRLERRLQDVICVGYE